MQIEACRKDKCAQMLIWQRPQGAKQSLVGYCFSLCVQH